jgi:hypothetical protein
MQSRIGSGLLRSMENEYDLLFAKRLKSFNIVEIPNRDISCSYVKAAMM